VLADSATLDDGPSTALGDPLALCIVGDSLHGTHHAVVPYLLVGIIDEASKTLPEPPHGAAERRACRGV
jgi:hypothetical protein